jgi:hypothetical protein
VAATPEGTIWNRRQRIRRLLEHLRLVDVSRVEHNCTGGNHRYRGKRGNINSTPNWNRQENGWAATVHPNSVGAVKASDHGFDSCLRGTSTDCRRNETTTFV